MKETLSTIAERTGLSISTISRVLSGKHEKYRISAATVEKVLSDPGARDYTPSLVAQSLRTKKTHTIGLLLPSLSNPFFAELASVMISEIRSRGFMSLVMDTMEDEEIFQDSARMLSRRVDGIIAAPCGKDTHLLEKINEEGLPIVLIDRYFEGSNLSYVTANNHKGSYDAVNMLISRGHKHIACIQGNTSSSTNFERVRGYVEAMERASLGDYLTIVGNEYSIQSGYVETRLLLNRSVRPTAIFALSNTISLGALKAVREAELSIPGDISLMGFDNYSYMDYMEPPLARVGQPVGDMAMLAIKILFDRIDHVSDVVSALKLSPNILPGGSIGAPSRG